ncbi:MAG TPA: alpha/beta hydrolase [Burkholderiaceae bacterium]|nr:alpha/beta hydrolase [Burkholderiaceae bacterium]
MRPFLRRAFTPALAALALAACTSAPWTVATAPDEPREHDARRYTVDEAALRATLSATDAAARGGHGAFLPLEGVQTDRWVGVLNGAAYQVEVPREWNGMLVMYAHGYRGTGAALTVGPPRIRRHLIANGYAWAASSYSANHYDVRAGVEDTNALALAFTRIARENGRTLEEPTRRFVTGHSMGGHVAGAAVERETIERARHRVRYDGAVPMCGVMGDTALYDGFAAYQSAALRLAGIPVTELPPRDWATIAPTLRARYFSTFPNGTTPGVLTPEGEKLRQVAKHLSGGERPGFEQAFLLPPGGGGYTPTVWDAFSRSGDVIGILARPVVDTRRIVYRLDGDPAAEADLNRNAFRVAADPRANLPRKDGVRWIPTLAAQVSVPVVTIHTLGDGYVWWSMQQEYRRRAEAAGTADRIVQRAIRGLGHCDFALAEEEEAFDAMTVWARLGRKPKGDEVLDAAVVASPTYGCRFTRATREADTALVRSLRTRLPACPEGSASSGF